MTPLCSFIEKMFSCNTKGLNLVPGPPQTFGSYLLTNGLEGSGRSRFPGWAGVGLGRMDASD